MQAKRMGFLCVVVVALVVAMTGGVFGQDSEGEMCVPMGDITIGIPDGVTPQKSRVVFPHSRHFATDCKTCHHTWKGEEKIQGCQTSGCHDQASAPKTTESYLSYSNESIKYFKYAYHQACIGCHKDIRAKNLATAKSYQVLGESQPAAGPSGCIECHPK
ncbi:MAG: cytochrome c3 family protein [Desulfobacterales bacterium]